MLPSNFQKSPIAEDQLEQKADFAGGEFPTTVYHQAARLKKDTKFVRATQLGCFVDLLFPKGKNLWCGRA